MDNKAYNKDIRVLHLISSLSVGGAEKLVLDIMSVSHEQKSISTIAAVMNDYVDEDFRIILCTRCSKVFFFDKKEGEKSLQILFKLLSIIKNEKIDIIHAHDYGSKMWAILCKFKTRIKIVYTFHSAQLEYELRNKISKVMHIKYVDMNIAISETVKRICIEKGINKVVRIYNGIDTGLFKHKENVSDIANSKQIVCVARINHIVKGQDIIIKAIKRCINRGVNVHCTFIGDYGNYHVKSHKYLLDLAYELGVSKFIEFSGKKTNIGNFLYKYDAFVLASRTEGLGIVVLEAMAAGIPVIASRIEGPCEIIKDFENGILFECDNDEDLSYKIERLLTDSDLNKKICSKAMLTVQSFNISDMYKSYCNIYYSLLGGINGD